VICLRPMPGWLLYSGSAGPAAWQTCSHQSHLRHKRRRANRHCLALLAYWHCLRSAVQARVLICRRGGLRTCPTFTAPPSYPLHTPVPLLEELLYLQTWYLTSLLLSFLCCQQKVLVARRWCHVSNCFASGCWWHIGKLLCWAFSCFFVHAGLYRQVCGSPGFLHPYSKEVCSFCLCNVLLLFLFPPIGSDSSVFVAVVSAVHMLMHSSTTP